MERFNPDLKDSCPQLYYEHVHRYLLAKAHIHGGQVLDLACGSGYGTAIIADKADSITGIDLSEDAIEEARARHKIQNVTFEISDCCNTPFASESFDYIVSFETIEHLNSPTKFISEITRLLKPTGLLILSSPDKLEYTDKSHNSNPYHIKELYHDELKQLLKKKFPHCAFARQRLVAGSLILADPEQDQLSLETGVYYGDHRGSNFSTYFPEAIYSIAFCSKSELPKLTLGIYENKLESAIVWDSREQIVPTKKRVLELESRIAETQTLLIKKDKTLASIESTANALQKSFHTELQFGLNPVSKISAKIQETTDFLETISKRLIEQFDNIKIDTDHIDQLQESYLKHYKTTTEQTEKSLSILRLEIQSQTTLQHEQYKQTNQRQTQNHEDNLRANVTLQNNIATLKNELVSQFSEQQERYKQEKQLLENLHEERATTARAEQTKADKRILDLENERDILQHELKNTRSAIGSLANAQQEIESLLRIVTDIEEQNQTAQEIIAAKDKKIEELTGQLEVKETQYHTATNTLKQTDTRIQTLETELSAQKKELAKETASRQNFEQRYEHLKSTFSWKISMPLRAARRFWSRTIPSK